MEKVVIAVSPNMTQVLDGEVPLKTDVLSYKITDQIEIYCRWHESTERTRHMYSLVDYAAMIIVDDRNMRQAQLQRIRRVRKNVSSSEDPNDPKNYMDMMF